MAQKMRFITGRSQCWAAGPTYILFLDAREEKTSMSFNQIYS